MRSVQLGLVVMLGAAALVAARPAPRGPGWIGPERGGGRGRVRARAQAPPCSPRAGGPTVTVKDIDPAIRAAAEVLGIVRTRALVIGQVNLPEYVGKGTIVDLEATGTVQPVEVSRYSYAIAIQLQASRLDFEGPQTPRTIRVVKGNRA